MIKKTQRHEVFYDTVEGRFYIRLNKKKVTSDSLQIKDLHANDVFHFTELLAVIARKVRQQLLVKKSGNQIFFTIPKVLKARYADFSLLQPTATLKDSNTTLNHK